MPGRALVRGGGELRHERGDHVGPPLWEVELADTRDRVAIGAAGSAPTLTAVVCLVAALVAIGCIPTTIKSEND